jgi:hypothetical protein
MKKQLFILVIVSLFSVSLRGQKNVPATITMKDGSKLEIYHFGKLICESNPYAETYTTLRGKYNESPTEIKNYADIKQLVLEGFVDPPMRAAGNQKGSITVIRNSGVSVALDEAELVMSCYGSDELFNQIKIQIINPLTDKPVEQTLEMKEIATITFK